MSPSHPSGKIVFQPTVSVHLQQLVALSAKATLALTALLFALRPPRSALPLHVDCSSSFFKEILIAAGGVFYFVGVSG